MDTRTENRFSEMKEIHQRFFPYMESFLNEQANKIGDEQVSAMIREFAIDKIASKPSSGSHLMYLIGKLLDIKINDSFFFVCASLEMCMVQAYCYNVGADGKSGYVGDRKNLSYKTAEILRESHNDFIDGTELLNDNQKNKLKDFTNKIYEGIYLGQSFDTIVNIYDNFEKEPLIPILITEDRKTDLEMLKNELEKINHFLSNYNVLNTETLPYFLWERVYGLSGYMNEMYPKVLADIFLEESKKERVETLTKYSFCYGMLLMICNDIQDFALDLTMEDRPTREKILSDAFIDIKNKRITHPIMNFLIDEPQSSKELLEDFYEDRQNIEKQKMIRNHLVLNGHIRKSLLEATAYAFIAKDVIRELKEYKDVSMLEDLVISLVKGNKYVKLLTNKFDIKIKSTDSEIKKEKDLLSNWLDQNKEKLSEIYP